MSDATRADERSEIGPGSAVSPVIAHSRGGAPVEYPQSPAVAALVVLAIGLVASVVNLAIPGFFSHDELQLRDRILDYGATPFGGWQAFRTQGFFRPLGYIVFEALMARGQYPVVAHAGLVAIHAINCVLIFFLARPRGARTAYLTAAFFAISPLVTFDVGWVASIYDVQCTTFLLGGLLSAQRWGRGGSNAWLAGLGLAVVGGVLTKETWIILGPCVLVLLVFASDHAERKRLIMVAAALGALAVLYLVGRFPGLTALGGTRGGPYSVALQNIPGNLALYIAFPFYLDAPEIAGVRGWNAYGALTIGFHVALLAAAIVSKNIRVYCASVLWYALYLAPILAIGQASTHYLYGAGAALALLTACLATATRAIWIARPVGVVTAALLAWHGFGIEMSLYDQGRCQTRLLDSLATIAPDTAPSSATARPTVAGTDGAPWWVLARALYVNEDTKGSRGKFVFQQELPGADYHFQPDCIVVRATPPAIATPP